MNLLRSYSERLLRETADGASTAASGTEAPADGVVVETPAAPATSVPVVVPPDALQGRVDQLTREKWESKRHADALAGQVNELQGKLAEMARERAAPPPAEGETPPARVAPPEPTYTAAQLQALASSAAVDMRFAEDVKAKIVEAGQKAYPDFDSVVGKIRDITGPVIPRSIVEAALETDEAPKVLYELGKNPQKVDELLALSPARQAVAVAKFAASFGKRPVEVSGAPAPVTPKVSGNGARSGNVDLYEADKSTTEEWIAERERGIAEKRKNGARR